MPITFEKVDDGSIKLIWMTEIQKFLWVTTSKPEIFQRINFKSVIPDFSVSCLLRLVSTNDTSKEDSILTYTTELRLVREKCKTTNEYVDIDNCETNLNRAADCSQSVPPAVPLPYGIWASINGGDKSPLKESPSGLWKSDQFLLNFSPSIHKNRLSKFNCRIWIAFDTSISPAERNVLKDVIDMYVHQKHCDVLFCFQDDLTIGGHSSILSARNRVFADMFQQKKESGRIHIQDVQFEIFYQLLYYLYSGRISLPLTEGMAQLLFVAAKKYLINDLQEECVTFLQDIIRMDNAVSLMIWAHINSVENFKEAVLTFVVLHGEEICLRGEWEELTKNYSNLCVLATRRIIAKMASH